MATTPNYGFIMPDPTDFVTDLPADFEIFGDEVDARIKALNPETTAGDIAYRGATANAKDRLAIGTAGQVLTVNSGATAPEWATPSSGSLTQLATGTFSGSAVNLTSISQSYTKLLIFVSDLYFSSTDTDLLVRVNSLTGIYTTGYPTTGVVTAGSGFNQTSASIARFWNTDQETFVQIEIPNYTGSHYKIINNDILGYLDAGGTPSWFLARQINGIRSTAAINEINFLPSTGTFSGGTYTVYGVN
jgi:hypothetical protein